jgi:transposase
MIVGAVLDGAGRPICCQMWPGNITDVTTLLSIVDRLKERFHIGKVCVVADRGMISKDTIAELEKAIPPVSYILGVRMHRVKEVRDELLMSPQEFRQIVGPKSRSADPSPLAVREQWIGSRRYIVCRNKDQAVKDAADRQAIVESLREKLKSSDKNLVGNKGYRKYLKTAGKEHFSVDEAKIKEEERFDGTWVLRTNTELSAEEVALKYKQLWMVEEIFRSLKSLLETRPIYHHMDATIRGHVFCSFLAMVVLKELEARMEKRGVRTEWADVKRDLRALQEVELDSDGRRWYLRTELRGVCHDVLQAVGVAVPSAVRN